MVEKIPPFPTKNESSFRRLADIHYDDGEIDVWLGKYEDCKRQWLEVAEGYERKVKEEEEKDKPPAGVMSTRSFKAKVPKTVTMKVKASMIKEIFG